MGSARPSVGGTCGTWAAWELRDANLIAAVTIDLVFLVDLLAAVLSSVATLPEGTEQLTMHRGTIACPDGDLVYTLGGGQDHAQYVYSCDRCRGPDTDE